MTKMIELHRTVGAFVLTAVVATAAAVDDADKRNYPAQALLQTPFSLAAICLD